MLILKKYQYSMHMRLRAAVILSYGPTNLGGVFSWINY